MQYLVLKPWTLILSLVSSWQERQQIGEFESCFHFPLVS